RTRRLFWILAAARLAHAVGAPRRVHAQPQSRRRARRCLLEPALVPGAVLCDRHDGWRRTDRQAASRPAAVATRAIVRALTVPRSFLATAGSHPAAAPLAVHGWFALLCTGIGGRRLSRRPRIR